MEERGPTQGWQYTLHLKAIIFNQNIITNVSDLRAQDFDDLIAHHFPSGELKPCMMNPVCCREEFSFAVWLCAVPLLQISSLF